MVGHLQHGEALKPHLTFLVRFMEARKHGRHPFHLDERQFKHQLDIVDDPYEFTKKRTSMLLGIGYRLSRTSIEVATHLDVFHDMAALEQQLATADDPENTNSERIVAFVSEKAIVLAGRLWNSRFPTILELSVYNLEGRYTNLVQDASFIYKTWRRLRHLGALTAIKSIEHYQLKIVKCAGPLYYPLLSPHADDMTHYTLDPERLQKDLDINLPHYHRRKDVHIAYGIQKGLRLGSVRLYTIPFTESGTPDMSLDVEMISGLLKSAPMNYGYEEGVEERMTPQSEESYYMSGGDVGLLRSMQRELDIYEEMIEPQE